MKQYIENDKLVLELTTEGYIPKLEKQSFYKDAKTLLEKAPGIPAVMFSGGLDAQILVKSLMANVYSFYPKLPYLNDLGSQPPNPHL
jgi:hypothetical protein